MNDARVSEPVVPPSPRWRSFFLAAIALLLLSGGLAIHQYFRFSAGSEGIDRSTRTLETVDELVVAVLEAETRARGFLLTGRSTLLEPYDDARARVPTAAATLLTVVGHDPTQRAHAAELAALSRLRLNRLESAIEAHRAGRAADAFAGIAPESSGPDLNAFQRAAAVLKAEGRALLAERAGETRLARQMSLLFAIVSLLLAGTLGVVAAAVDRSLERRRDALEREMARRQRAERSMQSTTEELLRTERQARVEAERATRMKDEFLSMVSHELRTPLNSIVGWVGVLKQDQSRETLRKAIEVIDRNSKRQAQLIDDLLDVSRIVSGTLALDRRQVDLFPLIGEVAALARTAADAKGVSLRVTRQGPAPVNGDPVRLQQIVWNLVNNAVKFSRSGGTVQVALRTVDGRAEIDVTDDGSGIPPDVLPRIFDRFQQADSSSTRRYGGLGVGLAIVKSLVETHGGTVTVASAGAGLGSTFTVVLPLGAAPRDPADGDGDRSPQMRAPLTDVVVMVVDDEADARELVQRLLEDAGARVSVCGTAEAALRSMQEGLVPDVIVSDVAMPEQDGYDFMKRVRQMQPPMSSVPAAALTALARVADRRRALLAGFQTHLTKPVDPAELVATVATLAGRNSKSSI